MGIGPHCVIVCTNRQPPACLALVASSKGPRAVRLTNIFPAESGHIPPKEYNAITEVFVRDFRKYVRLRRLPIRLALTAFRLSLETAIPSKVCRKHFQSYLAGYPLTFHPSDVGRLDHFICALHRYHAAADLDVLTSYLTVIQQWSSRDANAVRDRVTIGLQVLAAYTRFR